jgi:hypothetical protein
MERTINNYQRLMDFRVDDAKMRYLQQFLDDPTNRRLINRLRTRYWYVGVKQKTGLTNAYQLERHFEPLTKTDIDSRTPFRNKWSKYQADKSKPGPALTSLVDAKIPGSARELNHPLWDVLRLGERVLPKIDSWMETLESRVQAIVYPPPKDPMHVWKLRQPYTPTLSYKLVKLGNLDALTALLLYWLESKRFGNNDDNQCQVHCIYQLLLMMGMDLCGRNIAEELFMLFLASVFNQTEWGDRRFGINPVHYLRGVELLEGVLYQVPDLKPFSSGTARCQAMCLLLSGKRGYDVHYGLNVLLIPNWQLGPPTEQQWGVWLDDYRCWQWGWLHLNRGTHGRLPDDKLWELLQALN